MHIFKVVRLSPLQDGSLFELPETVSYTPLPSRHHPKIPFLSYTVRRLGAAAVISLTQWWNNWYHDNVTVPPTFIPSSDYMTYEFTAYCNDKPTWYLRISVCPLTFRR